jgi:hypothetical protein
MEKPLGSDSCAGLVGSEFGAGGIFAEGKNPRSLLQGVGKWKSRWAATAAQGLLVRNLEQEGSLPKAKILLHQYLILIRR